MTVKKKPAKTAASGTTELKEFRKTNEAIGLRVSEGRLSLLSRKIFNVMVYHAQRIRNKGENAPYLPGLKLPESLVVKRAAEIELAGCDLICLAVPSKALPNVVGGLADRVGSRAWPPDVDVLEYGDEDRSWAAEWEHFRIAVHEDRPTGIGSALYALGTIEEAYRLSGYGTPAAAR